MSNKTLKKLIIWAIVIAVITVSVVLLVTFINKPESKVIFDIDESGTLVKYNGKDADIVIPKDVKVIGKEAFKNSATIETVKFEKGTKIESIAKQAFESCVNLSSVEIPNQIEDIGSFAFAGCIALVSADIPSSVKTLGDSVFNGCSLLESIVLNEGLEQIGNAAFQDTRIKTIYIPSTVVTLGEGTFNGCENLTSLELGENNQSYKMENDILYTIDGTELVLSLAITIKEFTIPATVSKIQKYAFYLPSSLQKLIVPNTVEEIGASAFMGCSDLRQLTLPFIGTSLDGGVSFDAVFGEKLPANLTDVIIKQGTKVVERAFQNVASIVNLTLPSTINAFGREAFYGCSNLKELDLNKFDNIKVLPKGLFTNCAYLSAVTIPDTVEIIEAEVFKGCSKLKTIVVPSTVKSIGEGAFSACPSLTSMTLPFIGMGHKIDSVTGQVSSLATGFETLFGYIFGTTAGNRCEAVRQFLGEASETYYLPSLLTEVTISNIDKISTSAFYGCSMIRTLHLPNKITEIGDDAFNSCLGLTSFTLPTSLTKIGERAFNGCKNLTTLIATDSKLQSIGERAFYGCATLVNIDFPETLTEIHDLAFGNCIQLNQLDLTYVTELGNRVFYGCDALANVTIGDTNPNYKIIDQVLYTKDGKTLILCLSGRTAESYTVLDTVETIIASAFVNCSNLKTVVITNNVQTIEKYTFVNCSNLTLLTVPFIGTSLTTEDKFDSLFALNKPTELNLVVTGGTKVFVDAFFNCFYLKSVALADSFLEIESLAFDKCNNLTSVTLPNQLTSIGGYAFSGCSQLSDLVIPSAVEYVGDYAFEDCTSLSALSFSSSLTTLGKGAFKNCSSLGELTIDSENQNYKVVEQVVYSKDGKTLIFFLPMQDTPNFVVPSQVEKIDDFAFSGANHIVKIIISDNVQVLGVGLFTNCQNLEEVTLPTNTEYISDAMFEGCVKLKEVKNTNNLIEIGENSFKDCKQLRVMPSLTKVTIIGANAFENCLGLTEVTIPDTITSLANGVFKGCEYLTTIHFPDTLEKIGKQAFMGCKKLSNFKIPSQLKEIGNEAFRDCTGQGLTQMILPNGLISIGNNAFDTCSWLETLYIPESVLTIGDGAFANLYIANLFSNMVVVEITKDETGKEVKNYTYPEGWYKQFWNTAKALYGQGEFTMENGIPIPPAPPVEEE